MTSSLNTIKRLFIFGFITVVSAWFAGLVLFFVIGLTGKPSQYNKTLTSDAIVVLTGGQNRIDEGLALFAAGKASNLFISGVHPDVKAGDIQSRWHGNTALPPCCIILGKHATTTVENAQETKEWAQSNDIQSILLVTSNYHMPRAALEIKAGLPDVTVLQYPIVQSDLSVFDLRLWELLFSEYHKFLLRNAQLFIAR